MNAQAIRRVLLMVIVLLPWEAVCGGPRRAGAGGTIPSAISSTCSFRQPSMYSCAVISPAHSRSTSSIMYWLVLGPQNTQVV